MRLRLNPPGIYADLVRVSSLGAAVGVILHPEVGRGFPSLFCVWVFAMIVSCQTPTTPEVPDEGQGSIVDDSVPGSGSSTVNPPVVANGKVTGVVKTSSSKAYCKATNKTDESVPVFLAIYLRPGTQHRIALREILLLSGKTRTTSARLPTCEGCETIRLQIDCVAYEEPPEIYVFGDRMPGEMLDNTQWEKTCFDCSSSTTTIPPTCEPKECPFGYEWNQNSCKCEGLLLCHVSNKGKDGNWNLQESQKKFSPGHEKHLDSGKFCPPDYFGVCSNKYEANPHFCMSN